MLGDMKITLGKEPEANRGGRPNAFAEPTERLNVLLPAGMVRAIRQQALERSKTPGQVLAAQLASTYLPVVFHLEGVTTYSDHDSAEALDVSLRKYVPGYLTVDSASGYSHLIATDDQGNTLDSSYLSLVYTRGSTTLEALEELVAPFPQELFASKFPCPDTFD